MDIFKAMVFEPDLEWTFIAGSIVKAHQQNTGVASKEHEAIGKSKGGNTTKTHMATGGEVQDCKIAPEMIEQFPSAEHIIADKGYNSEEVRN